MQQTDFVQLVRWSEQACEQDGQAYRRAVWRFVLLGYGTIVALAVLGAAALALAGLQWMEHGPQHWSVPAALAGAAMLWFSATAMLTRIEQPAGYRIERSEAPDLFRALSRIRKAVHGPRIDSVVIDTSFKATIVQRPRWGLFGQSHTLVLGWPLLCAVEPRRLFAVISHEYGHLRGDQRRFSAWIYRTRAAWWRLHTEAQMRQGPMGWLLRRFFAWYIPRFSARTFAMARQDEFQADQIAAKLCTPDVVAQAVCEIEIRSRWHDEQYWWDVWRKASRNEQGQPTPYADMMRKMRRPPTYSYAQEALRRALSREAHYDDTHPTPIKRLEALGVDPDVPDWSRKQAVQLLGSQAPRIARQFDDRWWDEVRDDWGRHREQLKRCLDRIQALKARANQLTADEWVDWADCFEALSNDDSSVLYEHALHRNPMHPTALRRLAERRVDVIHPEALALLERLQEVHPHHGRAACEMALTWLDRREFTGHDVAGDLRELWRRRLVEFEQLEQQAWDEFSHADPCEGAVPPQCSDAERRRIIDQLMRTPAVKAAWLVGQEMALMPQRSYLVLFVELATRDKDLADETCEALRRALPWPERLRAVPLGRTVKPSDIDAVNAVSLYRRRSA